MALYRRNHTVYHKNTLMGRSAFLNKIENVREYVWREYHTRPERPRNSWMVRRVIDGNLTGYTLPDVVSHTYISKFHFFLVIHAVYSETALVDEDIESGVFLQQKFCCT